jgi:hypothetical protein
MELLDPALVNNLGPNEPTNRLMREVESYLPHNYHHHRQLQGLPVMTFQFSIKISLLIPHFFIF